MRSRVILAALLLVVAACGGDDEAADPCPIYRAGLATVMEIEEVSRFLLGETLGDISAAGADAFVEPAASEFADQFGVLAGSYEAFQEELDGLGNPPPQLEGLVERMRTYFGLSRQSNEIDAAMFTSGEFDRRGESEQLFQQSRTVLAEIEDLQGQDLCGG